MRARLVGRGSRSGRSLVPGDRRFPQRHGQGEGGRTPADLAGQGPRRVRQTVEWPCWRVAWPGSLLERRPVPGTGGDIPSVHEVVRDARFG